MWKPSGALPPRIGSWLLHFPDRARRRNGHQRTAKCKEAIPAEARGLARECAEGFEG